MNQEDDPDLRHLLDWKRAENISRGLMFELCKTVIQQIVICGIVLHCFASEFTDMSALKHFKKIPYFILQSNMSSKEI